MNRQREIVAAAAVLAFVWIAFAPGCKEECGEGTCFQQTECVETCGGEIVQTGCCACPEGTVDRAKCPGGSVSSAASVAGSGGSVGVFVGSVGSGSAGGMSGSGGAGGTGG
jgi:hypothetical protein